MLTFSNYLWVFNCFSPHITSGAKRILLSPASPSLHSQPKEWHFFHLLSESLVDQNHHLAQRQRDLEMCLRLQLRKDLLDQMKAKQIEETAVWFPPSGCPVDNSHIPCTPSCATPNEASSLYVVDRREHEALSLERKPLSCLTSR